MLFNSFDFLIFLIVVFILSSILRKHSKRGEIWFLVIASAFFYGQWNWAYLLLIYVTICTDYLIGIKYFSSKNPRKYLNISLLVNLGILGFFKYANFLLDSSNQFLNSIGTSYKFEAFDFLLPVGISFYTFQSLSYTIDIHRGDLKPRKRFSDYALFVSFFPQLVAGPIVRASEFFEQLDIKRHFSFETTQKGCFLILLGLVKKVVFADNLALIADPVFNAPEMATGLQTLIAIYAFAFQIYFDFSGYTDIAIGVALLLGFQFPKNFNHPYTALSFQDFWRRWHMTLSRWLRDYLYISLGGNRKGAWKTQRNLFLTMFLGGLWHGASWNFAIWGTLHGLYLAIERKINKTKVLKLKETPITKFIKWLVVFNLVCFAWIFFRAQNIEESFQIIQNIFSTKSGWQIQGVMPTQMLLIAGLLLAHQITNKINLSDRCTSMSSFEYIAWQTTFIFTIILLAAKQAESFMYFQF